MKSDEWIKIAVVAAIIGVAVYLASKGVASVESAFAGISPLWLLALVPLLILVGAFFFV
jgi:hypothetical protein